MIKACPLHFRTWNSWISSYTQILSGFERTRKLMFSALTSQFAETHLLALGRLKTRMTAQTKVGLLKMGWWMEWVLYIGFALWEHWLHFHLFYHFKTLSSILGFRYFWTETWWGGYSCYKRNKGRIHSVVLQISSPRFYKGPTHSTVEGSLFCRASWVPFCIRLPRDGIAHVWDTLCWRRRLEEEYRIPGGISCQPCCCTMVLGNNRIFHRGG